MCSARPRRSAPRVGSSELTSPTSRPRKQGAYENATGSRKTEFVEASIDALPFEPASFDVVISNGVINLSPVKHRVFAEAARVLRPGGRLALADIVSGRALKERTRRNVELWAACIARASPRAHHVSSRAEAGLPG